MNRLYPEYFSFRKCRFNMPISKRSTARVVACDDLKIPYAFTLESSFHAYNNGATEFKISDWLSVGSCVGQAIRQMYHTLHGPGTSSPGCPLFPSSNDINKILFNNGYNILTDVGTDSDIGSTSDISDITDEETSSNYKKKKCRNNKRNNHKYRNNKRNNYKRRSQKLSSRLKKSSSIKRRDITFAKGLKKWTNRQGKFKAEAAERKAAFEAALTQQQLKLRSSAKKHTQKSNSNMHFERHKQHRRYETLQNKIMNYCSA